MQVKAEEVSNFTKKKLTLVIESEKELAMLYLRLNCPVASVLSENGIEYSGDKDMGRLIDIGMVLFDLIQEYIDSSQDTQDTLKNPTSWCRKAIFGKSEG